MSHAVEVPKAIEDEIESWALSDELKTEIYRRLREDLEYGHETTCFRLCAPSPTN